VLYRFPPIKWLSRFFQTSLLITSWTALAQPLYCITLGYWAINPTCSWVLFIGSCAASS
jgi:hypothetical protein